MKKIASLFVLLFVVSFVQPMAAVAATNNEIEISKLVAMVLALQDQLHLLQGNSNSAEKNLSITKVTVQKTNLAGNKTGLTLEDQRITVRVSNVGIPDQSAQFKYKITLFEATSGQDILTPWSREGKAGAEYINGQTEFTVDLEGGLPYSPSLGVKRNFYAVISIDTANEVVETGESDNTTLSPVWQMSY